MSGHKSVLRWTVEIIIALVLLVLLLLWMAGAFHRKVGPGAPGLSPARVPDGAELHTLAVENIPAMAEIPGTIEPWQAAVLSAKMTGTLHAVNVRAGDRVAAGQVVAVIEAPELAAQVVQASGSVAASSARFAQAKRDLDRAEYLYREGLIARIDVERARTEFATASAAETSAAGAISTTRAMVDYRQVRALFVGLVVARHLDPGVTVSPGMPIVTVHDARVWQFVADVRAGVADALALHDTVMVRCDDAPETLPRTVAELQPILDPISHSRRIKVTVPARPWLTAGMFGRLSFVSDSWLVLVIFVVVVRWLGILIMVRVVTAGATGGVVESRYVRCGAVLPDGRLAVLAGLEPGERVLVQP